MRVPYLLLLDAHMLKAALTQSWKSAWIWKGTFRSSLVPDSRGCAMTQFGAIQLLMEMEMRSAQPNSASPKSANAKIPTRLLFPLCSFGSGNV